MIVRSLDMINTDREEMEYGFMIKMEYGFILCLLPKNGLWIHILFMCSKWNMDSYFIYVLRMEYGFILPKK